MTMKTREETKIAEDEISVLEKNDVRVEKDGGVHEKILYVPFTPSEEDAEEMRAGAEGASKSGQATEPRKRNAEKTAAKNPIASRTAEIYGTDRNVRSENAGGSEKSMESTRNGKEEASTDGGKNQSGKRCESTENARDADDGAQGMGDQPVGEQCGNRIASASGVRVSAGDSFLTGTTAGSENGTEHRVGSKSTAGHNGRGNGLSENRATGNARGGVSIKSSQGMARRVAPGGDGKRNTSTEGNAGRNTGTDGGVRGPSQSAAREKGSASDMAGRPERTVRGEMGGMSGGTRASTSESSERGYGGQQGAERPNGAFERVFGAEKLRTEEDGRGGGVLQGIFTRETVLLLVKGLSLLVLAFLFDRYEWFLSVRPFGIAFLCAAESGVGFVFGGLLLSALPIFGGRFDLISVVVCTAVVLLRVGARMTVDLPWKRGEEQKIHSFGAFCGAVFREHIALRMTVSAIAAFLLGLGALIGGGYQVYDLLAMLFGMIMAPAATFIFCGMWKKRAADMRTLRDTVSVVGTAAIAVLAFSELSLYGISLSAFTALGFTLWITHRKGMAVGILSGLAVGAAFDPVAAPLFAFGAIGAGVLKRVSVFMGALSALSVGMAWGLYIYGLGALSTLFPALLAASMLFCVLERLAFLPGEGSYDCTGGRSSAEELKESRADKTSGVLPGQEKPTEDEGLSLLRSTLAAERLSEEERRIEELCGAFLSVSDLLRDLHRTGKRPSAEEYRRVCDRVFDEFCPGCASCTRCWGSEYARMADILSCISEILCREGRVSADILPDDVRARCSMCGAIFLRINEEAGMLSASALKREKAGLLSADYGAAASLFRSASRSAPEEYVIDEGKSRDGETFLRQNGVYPSRTAVSGGRRGCLYAWNVEKEAAEKLFSDPKKRKRFSEGLGFLPGKPILTPIPGGGGLHDMRVPAAPRYRIKSAYAYRSASVNGREEGACGDSVAIFDGADGRSFALLSDGMGSGYGAAHLSGICTAFLQKMLSTGGDTGVILRMLNDFLSAGAAGESSATVDLLDLDLYTGEGIFWKSGAAPTFILREGNLFRLTSRTAPAGILPEMDVQKTVFRLYPDDLVVMLSDGITDDGEDTDFLETALGGAESEEELLRAANRIADGRRGRSSVRMDDRSVILLRVEESSDDNNGSADGARAAG